MSERVYICIVGLILLVSLYFEQQAIIYGLSAWLLLESLVDVRLLKLVQKARKTTLPTDIRAPENPHRFEFHAIRAWHILFALLLFASYTLVHGYGIEPLWPVPWVLALAATAAGITNICPLYVLLVYAGFRHA